MELVSRAHLIWKRRVARDLAPHGLNPKQVFVLRQLAEGGGLAPSRIAELTFADRPTASSLLGTLERDGWVQRRRDPDNRRKVLVEFTGAGRAELAAVPERLWRSGRTDLDPEACFTKAERRDLLRLLERLNQWLRSGQEDAP